MTRPSARVLFVAAAGPARGFGHLIRCGVLADALAVRRELVLRGSGDTEKTATHLGWHLTDVSALDSGHWSLVVVDDPSPAERLRWVRLARSHRIPVATIHDGDSAGTDADLVIDGSLAAAPDARKSRLVGPRFAILNPRVRRAARARKAPLRPRVLVSLGGGAHVRKLGAEIAAGVVTAIPAARVDVAAGFIADEELPELAPRCRWVSAPSGLQTLLASSSVAVIGGGVTLYEALAIGTPAVVFPVVSAQQRAIDAARDAGAIAAVIPDATGRTRLHAQIAAHVTALLDATESTTAMTRRGTLLVDGLGTPRVVTALTRLINDPRREAAHHAA